MADLLTGGLLFVLLAFMVLEVKEKRLNMRMVYLMYQKVRRLWFYIFVVQEKVLEVVKFVLANYGKECYISNSY